MIQRQLTKILLVVTITFFQLFVAKTTALQQPDTFQYFAYGSNTAISTLTTLRRVQPLASSAAVLPNYRLRFNIPGIPGVEPSWACVEPTTSGTNDAATPAVFGVLYTLSAKDFASVGRSEGVPFGYTWKACEVVTYKGDGKKAGREALLSNKPVKAYTLVASLSNKKKDIPPSRAYRDLILRGAKEFEMDQEHVDQLENTPVGRTLGRGMIAGEVLDLAETLQKIRGN